MRRLVLELRSERKVIIQLMGVGAALLALARAEITLHFAAGRGGERPSAALIRRGPQAGSKSLR